MTEKAFLSALDSHGFTVKPKAKAPYKRILNRNKVSVAMYDVAFGSLYIEGLRHKVTLGTRVHLPLDILDEQVVKMDPVHDIEALAFYLNGDRDRRTPMLVLLNTPASEPITSRP